VNDILDDKQPQEEVRDTRTTAEIMARLFEIRSAKAALEAERKKLGEEEDGLSAELLRQMDKQGSTRVSTSLGTAIRTVTTLPVVDSWDDFYSWIKENDAFHLLQRRVSSPAYREIVDGGEAIPGVRSYEDVKVNLRSA